MTSPFDMMRFLRKPEDHLLALQKKYGDPFPLSFPGAPDIWMTGNSELAKAVFSAPPDSFHVSVNNPVAPLLGGNGLIMQSGQSHLSLRKEFMPHFSKKTLSPLATPIADVFFDLYQKLENSGTLVIQEFALKSTLKVVLKFIFPHLNREEMDEAEKLTINFLNSYSASFLFIPGWVPGTWKRFNRKKAQLDHRFYEFFLSLIAANSEGPLSNMKDAPKEYVLDHIRTFIVAGHETSATSLSWALYYIHKDVSIKKRLQDELHVLADCSKDDFLNLILENQFLDCIVKEALRIHPPVPFVTRKIVNRSFTLGNRVLNVNDELGVCIALLHRQPAIWENPSAFVPDRYIDRKYAPSEYAPFGGGTRKCIGSEFALLEMKILIGFLIRYCKSELIGSNIPHPAVMQITIGPKKPISLSFSKSGS